jgi:hypothetical protein
MFAGEVLAASKHAAHIPFPFLEREPGLRLRRARARAKLRRKGDIKCFGNDAREFGSLVEPAFLQPRRMERHRNQQFRKACSLQVTGEQLPHQFRNGQQAGVLVALQYSIDRETVFQNSMGSIECRRTLEALAAGASGTGGHRANGAFGAGPPRQIPRAPGAQHMLLRRCCAQHAGLRQEQLLNF